MKYSLLYNSQSIFFLWILLTNGAFSAQAQFASTIELFPAFKATYTFRFVSDTSNRHVARTEVFYLFFNDSGSIFISSSKFKNDSIIASAETQRQIELLRANPTEAGLKQITSQIKRTSYTSLVTKSYATKQSRYIDEAGLDLLYYPEDLSKLEWKLGNDIKEYGRLSCNSSRIAFRGRNYTAWYSPGVPVSDGPFKFCGLPGLIVHIIDDLNEVEYRLTDLQPYAQKIIIPQNSVPKLTTRLKLRELKIQHYLNPYLAVEGSAMAMAIDDQQKAVNIAKRKAMAEQHSNLIERD